MYCCRVYVVVLVVLVTVVKLSFCCCCYCLCELYENENKIVWVKDEGNWKDQWTHAIKTFDKWVKLTIHIMLILSSIDWLNADIRRHFCSELFAEYEIKQNDIKGKQNI